MYNNLLTSGLGPQLSSWAIQFLWFYWWFENVPNLLLVVFVMIQVQLKC